VKHNKGISFSRAGLGPVRLQFSLGELASARCALIAVAPYGLRGAEGVSAGLSYPSLPQVKQRDYL
jgi:hypothetical protein